MSTADLVSVLMHHRTDYKFDKPVLLSPHIVRLCPSPHTKTLVQEYELKVLPARHFVNWQQDPFGNHLARFVFSEATKALSLEVSFVAQLAQKNPFDFFLDESVTQIPFSYEPQLGRDLRPYLELTDTSPLLESWLANLNKTYVPTLDFLVHLMQAMLKDIGYVVRMEPGVQSCEQTLQSKVGSCRDSAWLLIQLLRHCGIAARFVSGYLIQLQGGVPGPGDDKTPLEDSADLHAWTEVYLPGAGWIGLDPTSGLFAGSGHIPLASAPEPASVAPIVGATSLAEVEFEFSNRVERLEE